MTDIDWTEIHKKFSEAFRAEEIGTNQSNKGGGPYVDARSVAERLDDVVGPGAWMTDFVLVNPASGAVECTLTIHGVRKADIGYPNSVMGTLTKAGTILENEPLKAAYSDAFKRAAVQWGIGRYLYPYASKRARKAEEDDTVHQPSPIQTKRGDGEAAARIIEKPSDMSAKTQAVAGHVPNLDAFREEVRAAVVTVAQAENQEATDIFHKAIKETGITTSGGMPKFNLDDLTKLRDWCNKRLEILV